MKGALIGQGREAEVFAWGEGQALKLFRPNFNSAAQEAERTRAAHAAGAPAPAVYGLLTEYGRTGIIFERVVGRSMLGVLIMQPWQTRALACALAELHAQMHACSAPELPSFNERLRRDIEAADLPEGARRAALTALTRLPEGGQLCHGDFHLDNVLLTANGAKVIDWVNATRGHPLADVARTHLLLTLGEPPPNVVLRLLIQLMRREFTAQYERRYFALRPNFTLAALRQWELPVLAARVAENVNGERPRLLARIQTTLTEVT